MTTKRKPVFVSLLALVIALSCIIAGTAFAKETRASAQTDAVYYNLITNGDFETEYNSWGVNGATPARVVDPDKDGNHIAKMTTAGFVQARLWLNDKYGAHHIYDQLYKVSFRMKLVGSGDTLQIGQFLARLKGNDGAFLPECYVGGLGDVGTPLNVWRDCTYYVKIADNRNGTYSVYASANLMNMQLLKGDIGVELSYLDVAVGCGNIGNVTEWYLDDYTMTPYGEYANVVENGDFETDFSAWGMNSAGEIVRVPENDNPYFTVTGVEEGATYELGTDTIVPEFDAGTATLKKDEEDAIAFASGTEITEAGAYVLTVTSNGIIKTVNFTVTAKQEANVTEATLELYTEEIDFGKGYTFNDNLTLTNEGNVYTVAGDVSERDLTEWGFKSGTSKAYALKLAIADADENVSVKLSGVVDDDKVLDKTVFDGFDADGNPTYIILVLDANAKEPFTVECKANNEKEPVTLTIKRPAETEEEVTTSALSGESEASDNHVGRLEGNWATYRIWHANFLNGNIYKVSYNMKLTSADKDATTLSGQFLSAVRMASVDENGNWSNSFDIVPDGTYIDVGSNAGTVLNEWKTYNYYLKFKKAADETYSVYVGTDLKNLKLLKADVSVKLGYVDLVVGAGNKGNVNYWYLDDFKVIEQHDSLIDNWDMTEPFTSWGVNSLATEHYYDEAKQSYVAKKTGGGWLNARIPADKITIGKLYRVNLQLKLESAKPASDAQFLIAYSGGNMGLLEIGANGDGYTPTNVYKSYAAYFKFELQEDGSVIMKHGNTKVLTDSAVKFDSVAEFEFLDIGVGNGNPGSITAWYVDNFTVVCVSPDEYNGEITVTVPQTLVVSGVKDGATYELGEDTVIPEFNVGTATLKKDDGEAKTFESGTAIEETGAYVLTVTRGEDVEIVNFTVKSTTKAALELYKDAIAFGKGYTFDDDLILLKDCNVYTVVGAVKTRDLTEWGFKSETDKAFALKLTIPNAGEDVSIKLSGGADEPKDLGKSAFDGDDFIYLVLDATQKEFTIECTATAEKAPVTLIIRLDVTEEAQPTLELYKKEINFGSGYTFNDDLVINKTGSEYTVSGEVTKRDLTEWGFKSKTDYAIAFKLTIPGAGEDVSIKLSGGADEPKDLGKSALDGDDFIYLVLDATQKEFTIECKATAEKDPVTLILKLDVTLKEDDSERIIVTGVIDNGSYLIGAGEIKPTFNIGTATLKKGEEEAVDFVSGTEITEAGDYSLTVTNGEESVTLNFTVTAFTYKIVSGKGTLEHEGNVIKLVNGDGIVKVEISAKGYVTRTITLTPDNNVHAIELVPAAQAFEAEITVLDGDGKPLTGFTFEIPDDYDGLYGNTSITDNLINILDVVGEIKVTVKKNLYADAEVTINKFQKTATVRLIAREITPDNTDYNTEVYGYGSFEKLPLTETPSAMLDGAPIITFVNGGGATIEVTDVDSHYGEKSLKVHSVGDRFVSRLIGGLDGQRNMYADRVYHVTWWLKGITENLRVRPRAYVACYLTGDSQSQGTDNNIGMIELGEAVTLSTTEWTKLEAEFMYSVRGGKMYLTINGKETEYTSNVEGKEIVDLYNFDLSLDARGDYYLDDITFFNTYSASVEVLGKNGDRVTEGVTFSAVDYLGDSITVIPEIDEVENLFRFNNLFGRITLIAKLDESEFSGLVSATYPNLTLAESYDASVKFADYAGNAVSKNDIKSVFAFDGAVRVEGEWLEDKGAYRFAEVMGDLKVYAYVQGYEQGEYFTVTRKNPDVTLSLKKIASSNDGMPGNLALNGDVERLDQLAMFNNTQYALEGISQNGENKWASFQPVLTLSDEAAVGEKSLRISTDTEKLCSDDPEYAKFMEENGLEHKKFGDRVAYRAGNGFLIDGTEYVFTTFLKAPAAQGHSTAFQYIFLAPINLCNNGQFNFWADPIIAIDGDCWHKMEVYFSFELIDDEAAAASGKYEYGRKAFVCKLRYVLDGEVAYNYHGVYGYNVYKDGVYAFYRPGENGEMIGFGEVDTTHHDGIDGQEGGRSFGSLAMFEPSLQVQNGDSLLVDGGFIVAQYTAEVTVKNRDLTPNDKVEYFRFTDLFTGEISYIEASEYYDEIDQVYYVPGLFNAYSVAVCDADKNPIEGLVAQTVSSESSRATVEYSYNVTITVVDQDGNPLTDVVVQILLANGSYAEAENNGDGTYTYEGLAGERNIRLRKASGSENSYKFPTGLSVSSSNATPTITVTRNDNDNNGGDDNPVTPSENTGKKKGCGCGSAVTAASLLAALAVLGAMCCVVFVGKKENRIDNDKPIILRRLRRRRYPDAAIANFLRRTS